MPNQYPSLSHIDWPGIRKLAMQGISLAQLAKQFGIKHHTIIKRSQREHWNLAAVRARIPVPSPQERKALQAQALQATQQLAIYSNRCRLNAAKILDTFLAYYAERKAQAIKKDSPEIASILKTASSFFAWDDAKQGGGNTPVINLNVLAARPAELAAAQVVQVHDVATAPDSKSSGIGNPAQGNPVDMKADRQISATDSA